LTAGPSRFSLGVGNEREVYARTTTTSIILDT
jgi:hypothetical protein